MTREEKVIEVARTILNETDGRGIFALINELRSRYRGRESIAEIALAIETVLGANGSLFVISDNGHCQYKLPKSTECDRLREDWNPVLRCMGYYKPRGSSWPAQTEVYFNLEIDRSKRRAQNPSSVQEYGAFMEALKILEGYTTERVLNTNRIILDEAIDKWFPLTARSESED